MEHIEGMLLAVWPWQLLLLLAAQSPVCIPPGRLQGQPVVRMPSGPPGGAALVCGSHRGCQTSLQCWRPG